MPSRSKGTLALAGALVVAGIMAYAMTRGGGGSERLTPGKRHRLTYRVTGVESEDIDDVLRSLALENTESAAAVVEQQPDGDLLVSFTTARASAADDVLEEIQIGDSTATLEDVETLD